MNTEQQTVNVGDFFEESWGYDQTNVDFYQVVKVSKTGTTIWLRHVGAQCVRSAGHADYIAPLPDQFDRLEGDRHGAGELRRRIRVTPYGVYCNMTSYSCASLWDCKPAYQTAMGWGH